MFNQQTLRPILLLLGTLLLFSGNAYGQTLESGRVTFEPIRPVPGSEVRVSYEAPEWFDAGAKVVLRARLRTPEDRAYGMGTDTRSITLLQRRNDGVYRGQFIYPDSVVFALFAVSTLNGEEIDTNLRQGWPLLAHDDEGRPLPSAFSQQTNDLTGRDFRGGLRAAQRYTEVYPGDPASWSSLSFFERQTLDGAEADSAAAPWSSLVPNFDQALSEQANPDPDLVSGLVWLAMGVDNEVAERWTDWLIEHIPAHPTAVQFQVYRALQGSTGNAPTLLASLDQLHQEYGPAHFVLLDSGFRTALQVGNAEDVLRWADRRARAQPWARNEIAVALAATPATRVEGMQRLREEVNRVAGIPADHRHLFATVDEHRAARLNTIARLQAALGSALMEEGDMTAALEPLETAAASLWQAELLRDLAAVRLAAADSLGAARALARVAVDPAVEDADSILVRGRLLAGAEVWSNLMAEAKMQLREWTLRDAHPTALPNGISLLNGEGERVGLESLLSEGAPTVVVMYSRYCGYCIQATPRIQSLSEELASKNVRVVVISEEQLDEVTEAFFAEHGYTGPIYHDVTNGVALALGSAGTPQYFVLDEEGMVRFRFTTLDEIPRQVEALLTAEG